ncbi:CHAT domain-containing protein [Synechocystis sp. PCC 7509]|uniref:CHAT domain-containing protein n=1 Tax=Synechocystis sp. PCC 7509 TaxID=927677 RepID=UPI0002AD19F3|nr:CHAT domain-containing protein [Synechocystis sp. PCC 7509]
MLISKRWRFRILILFLLSISFCLLLNLIPINPLRSQALPTNTQTITTAYNYYKSKQYDKAISLWLEALKSAPTDKVKANIHNNLASAYQLSGNLTEAVRQWEQAAKIYQQQPDNQSRSMLAKTLIDRAQVYNDLGQFRASIPLVENAILIAQEARNKEVATVAQGVLGNAYALAGDYDKSLAAYQSSLELAQELGNARYITIALNNQVNLLQARQGRYLTQSQSAQQEKDTQEKTRLATLIQRDRSAAIAAANRAVALGNTVGGTPQVKALLNIIALSSQPDLVTKYNQQALSILDDLPPSRNKANALIQLTQYQTGKQKVDSLEKASAISASLGDFRTQSFALGANGHVYEQSGQLQQAMKLTRQAQSAAESVSAFDSLYRWQWQAGRIYQASNAPKEAITSYKQAIATLQRIRGDVVSANTDLQFDIRDSVEPVYRELMALLLDKGQAQEALSVSQLLKLTELQSFFGDECLQVKIALSTTQQPLRAKEAVINFLILSDRTYLILRLPDGTLKSYPAKLTAKQMQSEIEQFRTKLEDFGTDTYLEPAQRLYNLLIRPMAADLAQSEPNTLIFINDGVLRNIPMAALHDGKQFLVQKYAVSTSLGLGLNTGEPQKKEQKALVFGLTVKVPPFDSLPNVNAETQSVNNILGGKRFLDQKFTLANLEKQIGEHKNYSVLHLATHGRFRGTANSTFLQAYDRRISLQEFEDVLLADKEPVNLLTLSACQTAAGDNRSILGIAGLAARTGVKNILASLWFVNDADTVTLIESFYSHVHQPGTTKAEALRKAQLSLISIPNSHPVKWSSFILVNN